MYVVLSLGWFFFCTSVFFCLFVFILKLMCFPLFKFVTGFVFFQSILTFEQQFTTVACESSIQKYKTGIFDESCFFTVASSSIPINQNTNDLLKLSVSSLRKTIDFLHLCTNHGLLFSWYSCWCCCIYKRINLVILYRNNQYFKEQRK